MFAPFFKLAVLIFFVKHALNTFASKLSTSIDPGFSFLSILQHEKCFLLPNLLQIPVCAFSYIFPTMPGNLDHLKPSPPTHSRKND